MSSNLRGSVNRKNGLGRRNRFCLTCNINHNHRRVRYPGQGSKCAHREFTLVKDPASWLSCDYTCYTIKHKIYTKYQAAAARPGPEAWYFVYIYILSIFVNELLLREVASRAYFA